MTEDKEEEEQEEKEKQGFIAEEGPEFRAFVLGRCMQSKKEFVTGVEEQELVRFVFIVSSKGSSIVCSVQSFFASQTLHNRKNFKKKSGDVIHYFLSRV